MSLLQRCRAFACLGTVSLLAVSPAVHAQNPATTINVDVNAGRHAIDPRIYGTAYASTANLADLNFAINRYGGNNASRYNWQQNADNRGSDWFFESIGDTSATAGERGDTFIQNTRAAGVGAGTRILVHGASGACGTAVVQLARHHGARVTAVCGTKNVELVRSLGADEVIDYQLQDFRRNGETYDVVVDAVGLTSLLRCRRSVKPGGIFVATDLGRLMLENPFSALVTRWVGERRVRFPLGRWTREDLLFLKELMETGRYRAVVDRTYPLEDVVEATTYVETGQKTGNVVLVVG